MKLFGSDAVAEQSSETSALAKVLAYRQRKQVQQTEPALDKRPAVPAFATEPVTTLTPFTYQKPLHGVVAQTADALYTGASWVSTRVMQIEILNQFLNGVISSTAKGYNYNMYLTPKQLEMKKKGYVLFINPTIAADLNAFGRMYSQKVMSASALVEMVRNFDKQFTPKLVGSMGPGIFEFMVNIEFPVKSAKKYDSSKQALTSANPIGGMKGGANGHYWGITQFGRDTYAWIRNLATGWGVKLPATRQALTFGEMLVVAYCYAIQNQSYLVGYGVPVNQETIYVAHNQGAGIFGYKSRKVPTTKWAKQSATAKLVLLKQGFTSA